MSPRVVARCFWISLDHLLFVFSGSIKSWLFSEVKSTFCGRHVLSGANVFGCFFFYFLFYKNPFILSRTVHFVTPLLIFQAHFFCFYNMCLFQTSSDVARHNNIFLLYSVWLQSPLATCSIQRLSNYMGIVKVSLPQTWHTLLSIWTLVNPKFIADLFVSRYI